MTRTFFTALCLAAILAGLPVAAEVTPDAAVLEAEGRRIAVIEQASLATVAVFDGGGQGGGSAVLISPDGFALTNFHVTAPCGAAMKCGLTDGQLYDAVLVGMDPVGDLALIQLLGREDFPHAEFGDSDAARVGDWVFVAGDPFLLADDFRPSISFGMLSGVHRYQYPAGTLLEYTDCLQTDAAINPGNSGGPLFDAEGKLLGINGRGSFEKRGRVNVGVGYAISINQIKRFLSHLQSGRIVDHATLGATVSTEEEGRVVVDDILETSDAFRRGLRYGDEIVRFAGREITTANAFKNAMGVFPRGWIVPLTFRREGKTFDTRVRLTGLHDQSQLFDLVQQEAKKPPEPPEHKLPQPEGEKEPKKNPRLPFSLGKQSKLPEAVSERYEARRGYANYWYNLQKQRQLWDRYLEQNAPKGAGYAWQISGRLADDQPFTIVLEQNRSNMRLPWGNSGALFQGAMESQLSPPRSGGLLLAIHLWQRLLDKGLRQFGEVYFLGQLPLGPNGEPADCLVGIYAGIETRFLFAPDTGQLIGIEMLPGDDADPCEISFSEFGDLGGQRFPKRWQVRYGEGLFADLRIDQWQFGASAAEAKETEN